MGTAHPAIGSQNYKGVDRCLGPNSLLDAPVELPWAIVDAPWAEKKQEFTSDTASLGRYVRETLRVTLHTTVGNGCRRFDQAFVLPGDVESPLHQRPTRP